MQGSRTHRLVDDILKGLLFAVIVFIAVFGTVQSVGAVSYISPDPADNTDDTWLEVAQGGGGSLDAPSSTVVIYSTVPNPRIIVDHYHHCTLPGQPFAVDSSMPFVTSGSDTSFTLYAGGEPAPAAQIGPSVNNSIFPEAAGCAGQSLTFNPGAVLPGGNSATGTQGFYLATMRATMTLANGTNAFKVRVVDQAGNPAGYVSYTNQDGFRFSLQKRPGSSGGQSNIGIKFALPCNAAPSLVGTLAWFDDDYNTGNQAANLRFELWSRPRGSGGPYDRLDYVNTSFWGGQGTNMQVNPVLYKDRDYIWNWINVNNSNGIQFTVPFNSVYAQVTCIDFNLTPTISVNPTLAEPGANVTASPRVSNGGSTASTAADWQVSRFRLVPGEGIPNSGGGSSPTDACAGYFKPPGQCSVIASGNQAFNVGVTNLANQNSIIDDLPVGSRICFALSVRPPSVGSGDWRHSAPVCVKIGKKPKVVVHGHDVVARGSINTSTATKSGTTYGSWVEYAAFSQGANQGFASSSKLNGGHPSPAQTDWDHLTFANTPSFGSYGTVRAIPDAITRLTSLAPVGALGATEDLSGKATGLHNRTGNLTISGGNNIARGQWLVLNVTGTVTIDSNITYSNAAQSSLADIPQVVIIANNINIRDSVGNIDAWLITRGTTGQINTCYNGPAQLTVATCNQLLSVNGPVMTGRLHLRRTGGSGTGAASGNPAEVFNMRPDALLWSYARAGGSDKAQTVYIKELPPRF